MSESTTYKYHKTIRKLKVDSICVICDSIIKGNNYNGNGGYSVILSHKKFIFEPYHLCDECKEKAEIEGEITED